MRTLVKWLAIGAGSIAILLVLAVATLYAVSSYKLGKRHDVSPQELAVMPDSAAIAYGARLATILGCHGCHGADLEGRIMFNQRFIARVVAPNLTEVRGVYSDRDFVRMLRHGVRPDGRSAIPAMPSPSYTYLTDEDLAAIIAYVRSVPPTGEVNFPSTRMGLLVRFALVTGALSMPADIIDHARPPQATVDPEDLEGFGWYLSHAVCTECHGSDLRGSDGFLTTPNLAIAMAYTGEQFREFLRTGVALGGREIQGMSPLARDRYASFTDHEIDALHAYLTTLAATTSAGEP
jgi:mono/diheme cytochrome c family protein